MASLHTFCDFTQISQPSVNDAFGPQSETEFQITTKFTSSGNVKAYAAVKGNVFIQKSTSNTVTLILKPLNNHEIDFTLVKFFVYRGLRKDNFLDATENNIRAKSGASPFIQNLYTKYEELQIKLGLNPNDPIPAKSLGISSTQNNTDLLESFFFRTDADYQFPIVDIGVELGSFVGGSSSIGFEIILEEGQYQPTLAYARNDNYSISIPSSLTNFNVKGLKEEILNFVDPAAYYGMHFEKGIDRIGSTSDLYVDVIGKFKNANKVYLDIRNENGLSLNFYENYSEATGTVDENKHIKVGVLTPSTLNKESYDTLGWPIFSVSSPVSAIDSKNSLFLSLKFADNQNPLVFAESGNIVSKNENKKFVFDTNLVGSDTVWTLPITFNFPNQISGTQKLNISTVIKLYYFRQTKPVSWPSGVIPFENYFDGLLGPINLKPYWGTNANINWISNQDYIFREIEGSKQLMERGIAFEGKNNSGRVLLYAALTENIEKGSEISVSSIKGGTSAQDRFLEVIFAKSFILNFNTRKISTSKTVNILNFNRLSKTVIPTLSGREIEVILPARSSSLVTLGISANEYTQLNTIASSYSPFHPITVFLDNKTELSDLDSKPYCKYTITLKGLDNNGSLKSSSSTIEVFTLDNLTFVSVDFSVLTPLPSVYTRNYEEAIGIQRVKPDSSTDKTVWEDFFIAKDTSAALTGSPDNTKKIVDDFIEKIGDVAFDINAKTNIITEINNYGTKLLARARAYVKNIEPDDRILYWARLKMGVALKSHPLLLQKPDDRNEIIQLFEDKTRGYTAIDFSTAGARKKVLITGFDPFGLDSNQFQSNPSGAVALKLGGETFNTGTKNVLIQSIIVPVRYEDFNNNIVDKYIAPHIGEADMIITISQSLFGNYNIDRFATVIRGGGEDNMGIKQPKGSRSVEMDLTDFNKWKYIETTLPKKMVHDQTDLTESIPDICNHYVVFAQHYKPDDQIKDFPDYKLIWDSSIDNLKPKFPANILTRSKKGTPPFPLMEEGSGGNYLSNEIFYRVSLAREKWSLINAKKFPSGHFHVAWIQPYDDLVDPYEVIENLEQIESNWIYRTSTRTKMSEQIKLIETVKLRILIGIESYNDESDLF